MDHPAASATDESFLPSFGKHKVFQQELCYKVLKTIVMYTN